MEEEEGKYLQDFICISAFFSTPSEIVVIYQPACATSWKMVYNFEKKEKQF